MSERAQRAHGGARGQRQQETGGPQRVAAEQREEPRRAGGKELVVGQRGDCHAQAGEVLQRRAHPARYAAVRGADGHIPPRARRRCGLHHHVRGHGHNLQSDADGATRRHRESPCRRAGQAVDADRIRGRAAIRGRADRHVQVPGVEGHPVAGRGHRHGTGRGGGRRHAALDLLHGGDVATHRDGYLHIDVAIEYAADIDALRQTVRRHRAPFVQPQLGVHRDAFDVAGDHRDDPAVLADSPPADGRGAFAVHRDGDIREDAGIRQVEPGDAGRAGVHAVAGHGAVRIAPQLCGCAHQRLHVVHPGLTGGVLRSHCLLRCWGRGVDVIP